MNDNELDVVVIGGANMDFLVHGKTLPTPGSTISGDEFQEAPGGKGANQAVAAARLGAAVALVSRVGADARGEAISETDTFEIAVAEAGQLIGTVRRDDIVRELKLTELESTRRHGLPPETRHIPRRPAPPMPV